MATNATTDEEVVVDDDKEVTEADLRDLKYGTEEVETSNGEDETTESEEDAEGTEETGEEDGQTDDQTEEDETEQSEESTFVKQFPHIKGDTPEEYSKNLEIAYQNSTAEAMRLKQLSEQSNDSDEESDASPIDTSNITSLYAKQKMDEEITEAYGTFSKQYSQVNDANEYSKFTNTVAVLSNTILQSEKRLASPAELYQKAAVILGWQSEDTPTKAEKIAAAAKAGASASKTSSATKVASKSKVTDAMISLNRKMYPGLSDDAIRKELEPYVQ